MPTSYCLTCHLFESGVYPLEKGRTYHLGRGTDNQIILPWPHVSRHHARIESFQDKFLIVDKGSRNGTRVNEAPLSPRGLVLEDHDSIKIGPYIMTFRALEGDLDNLTRWADPDAETDAIETRVSAGECLSGTFDDLGLIEICQFLSHYRKDGHLVVEGAGDRGDLVLLGGEVICVDGQRFNLPHAIRHVLSIPEGTFTFREEIPENCRKYVAEEPEPFLPILNELCKKRQEEKKYPTPGIIVS